MAGIDHSIYFQQRPVDFLGGISQGMKMRGQMDQRDAQKAEQQRLQLQREQQAEAQKALSQGIIQNPDGSTSFDYTKAMGGLSPISPSNPFAAEQMMNIEKTMYGRNQDSQRLAAEQEQRLWDREYKDRALQSSAADRAEARADRRYQFGATQQQKAIEKQEKKASVLNEVEDRRRNIDDNLGLLDNMVKDYGTYEMFGSHNADLDRRVEAVATDMAKLADPSSVARPSEVEAFKKGLISSSATDMRNSTARDILKNFRNEVSSRVDNAYKIRGLDNPGTQSERQGGGRVSELNMPPRATKQDSEAVQWAKQNPNDPRSSAILKANGFGG